MKTQFKQTALKLAIVSALAVASISSAYAANEIYIGSVDGASNNIHSLKIEQAGALNSIGTSSSARFNVDGKWKTIDIAQIGGTASTADFSGLTADTNGTLAAVGSPGDATYVPLRAANSSNGNVITGSIKTASTTASNTATLKQEGDGNRIALTVNAGGTGSTVVLGISQKGARNSSTYNMTNTGNLTVSEITEGNDNIVAVTASAGADYTSTIALTGNNNAVTVTRSGAFTATTDSISLTGSLNTVNLTGTAIGSNSVTLAASGNNNVFGITQSGAGSMANINVATNYKQVIVDQQAAGSQFTLAGTLTDSGIYTIIQR